MVIASHALFLLKLCAALSVAILLPASVSATNGGSSGTLFESACVIGSSEPLDFASVARRSDWNCEPTFRDAKAYYVWLRVDGSQLAEGATAFTGMAAPFEAIHLVAELADGRLIERRYQEADIRSHWMPTNTYAMPLDFAPAQIGAVYLRVDRPHSHLLVTEFAFESVAAAQAKRMSRTVLFAICAGMLLIVALLSGVMGRILHSRTAALHCAFTVLVTIYVLSASSLIFVFIPALSLWGRSFLSFASIALAFAMVGPIVLNYFGSDGMPKILRRAVDFSVACAIAAAFVLPVALMLEFDQRLAYHLLFVPGTLTYLAIMLRAARRRDDALKGFALAWFAPAVFGVERILRGSDLYYLPLGFDNLFYVGLALQAVIMTVVIARQADRLRRERDTEKLNAESALNFAQTDALTGLPNRRDLDLFDWSRAQYCAILDLDRFKSINDTYGHEIGDDVLTAVAIALKPSPEYGVLRAWRMGGEEFGVALDGVSIESAAIAFNRLRGQISVAVAEAVPGLPVAVTASAGLAKTASEPRETYRAADIALYRAKAAGRDKLSFESESGEFTTLFRAASPQPVTN